MGEKIKTLSKGKILAKEFEIELNHPPRAGLDEQIHIQSEKFRFEIYKKDYLKYALSVLTAEKNLKNLKGID
ncbi:hypothetical protein NAMH_1664 [Nautilia profundicola AmH]|uniref:Uncharacterized protein n=1 Tax=Nautilia profundicola (strain ATCC BAA-1463 / DSM 18972 / AmH) TaxID=598659 RepID=B9L6Q6_NAUPA|nr:hypothetical protein [Nautilia profundicola]ACM93703.1 hypothetical protein NAMH_1664 [Nautilia profundicola AmH]